MRFQVLGPIAVTDGAAELDIGGPQQRLVLALLVMYANEAVSTERIIDSLWQDEPPPTARKTIQGYVSSLRRTIGEGVITTTATGYRLEADRRDVDALDFADKVTEARQMADPAGRRIALRDALELWRGAAYDDVAYVDAFQPEIARLDELRLVALGEKLAADIEAGLGSAAIPPLEALVREHPLQERFRALLMLALYRSGRQTDALRVFEDARRHLAAEVGLEPGSELRLLEQRILDQDPALDEVHPLRSVGPPRADIANPYRGLRPFDEESGAAFHGRDALVRRLRENLDRAGTPRLMIVAGASGSGKSSVVRAGLVPQLRNEGWRTVTVIPGPDPIAEVNAAIVGDPRLVVIDQFENGLADPETAKAFLDTVAGVATEVAGPWVVITVRADYLDALLAHGTVGAWVERALVLVPPMTEHEVAAAVAKPAEAVGVSVTGSVAELIFEDMAGRGAGLPLMQYALTEMFDRRTGNLLTLDDYHRVHGLGGALASRAEAVYSALPAESQTGLRQALLQLVRLRDDGVPALRSLPRGAFSSEQLAALERFGEHRMVTFDRSQEPTVEIAHEALLGEWPRLTAWIDEARDSLLAQRRLSAAATEWETSGRDDAYLYGAALAARYQGDTAPAPGSPEAAFLEVSRRRSQAADRRRQRTRRLIVAGFGIAAVVSVVLAVVAGSRRQDADVARQEAEARALASASVLQSQTNTELGLLLAVEAYRADPTPAALGPLLNALGLVTGRSELFTASRVSNGDVVMNLVTLGEGGRNARRVPCVAEVGPGWFIAGNSEAVTDVVITDFQTEPPVIGRTAPVGPICQFSYDEATQRAITPTGVNERLMISTSPFTITFDGPVDEIAVDPSIVRAQWLGERILGFEAGADPIPLDLGDDSPKVRLAWVDPATGAATRIDRTAVTMSAPAGAEIALLTDRFGPVDGAIPMGDPPVTRDIVSGDDLSVIHSLGEMESSNAAPGWSDDGSYVGDVSRSGNLRIWNTTSGEQVVDSHLAGVGPDEAIWIDFAPSGTTYAVVSEGGSITLHQLGPEARQIGRVQVTAGSVAATSFIDDDRLAVMHEDGAVEIFNFGSLPFSDAIVNCCGPGLLAFFTEDGGSGAARLADGSLRIVDLPEGATQETDPDDDVVRVWRNPDGSVVAQTASFELFDLAGPDRRGFPFGRLQGLDSSLTASGDVGILNAWIAVQASQDTPAEVIVGSIDIATFDPVEGPHRIELPANTRYAQTVGDRLLVGDAMGSVHQFGFDGRPLAPRINLAFVPTNATTLPGSSIALFDGEAAVALVDLETREVISSTAIDSPSPTALVPDGFAVIGRQGDGLDLWSTEPLLRLGRIANADPEGLIQVVSIDEAGNVWYSSGERYQRIPIDPEAWIDKACELAGGTLTGDQWGQFVSATRPYDPAC